LIKITLFLYSLRFLVLLVTSTISKLSARFKLLLMDTIFSDFLGGGDRALLGMGGNSNFGLVDHCFTYNGAFGNKKNRQE
jgi:hypothetical protein